VGYAREGVIQNDEFRSVAYYDAGDDEPGVKEALAAYIFFFSAVLFEQPDWDRVLEP
jgi:hypothetical protein